MLNSTSADFLLPNSPDNSEYNDRTDQGIFAPRHARHFRLTIFDVIVLITQKHLDRFFRTFNYFVTFIRYHKRLVFARLDRSFDWILLGNFWRIWRQQMYFFLELLWILILRLPSISVGVWGCGEFACSFVMPPTAANWVLSYVEVDSSALDELLLYCAFDVGWQSCCACWASKRAKIFSVVFVSSAWQ